MAWGTSTIYQPPAPVAAPAAVPAPAAAPAAVPAPSPWAIVSRGFPGAGGSGNLGVSTFGGGGGGGNVSYTPGPSSYQATGSNYMNPELQTQSYLNTLPGSAKYNQQQQGSSLLNMLKQFQAMTQNRNVSPALTPAEQAYNNVNGINAVRYVPTPGYGNSYQPAGTPARSTPVGTYLPNPFNIPNY